MFVKSVAISRMIVEIIKVKILTAMIYFGKKFQRQAGKAAGFVNDSTLAVSALLWREIRLVSQVWLLLIQLKFWHLFIYLMRWVFYNNSTIF